MNSRPCPQPRRWRSRLSALIDGELPRDEQQATRAHLDACPDCRTWYEDARDMTRELRLASLGPVDGARHVFNLVEAHICGCHSGGECHCTDCHCDDCTCGQRRFVPLRG